MLSFKPAFSLSFSPSSRDSLFLLQSYMIFLILSCYVLVCFLLILVVWWFYDRFSKSEHSLFHHLPRNPIGFFKRIYFNWRIITLQYSDGFCHISTLTGHSHMCPLSPEPPFPPPSSPHPSRLSQSTSFVFPASCIKFSLAFFPPKIK